MRTARNRAAAELIGELFAVWGRLSASAALPDELYVIELGVGNGNQAKVFLDEFRDRDRQRGTGYHRRHGPLHLQHRRRPVPAGVVLHRRDERGQAHQAGAGAGVARG